MFFPSLKTVAEKATLLVMALLIGISLNLGCTSKHTTIDVGAISATTEICEVVEREQFINSPYGRVRIAIIRRSDGQLKDLHLDGYDGRSHVLNTIPAEARYLYVTGLNIQGKPPSSIVPIFPE